MSGVIRYAPARADTRAVAVFYKEEKCLGGELLDNMDKRIRLNHQSVSLLIICL